ncbi:unnamed protein product [Caretta caretta]
MMLFGFAAVFEATARYFGGVYAGLLVRPKHYRFTGQETVMLIPHTPRQCNWSGDGATFLDSEGRALQNLSSRLFFSGWCK